MAWDIDVKYKIYHRLANELFFRIYNGTYPLGSKLPSYTTLATEAGCGPETVRNAIIELQMHDVVRKTRFGYFVTSYLQKVLEYRDSYLAAVDIISSLSRRR